MKNSIRLAAFLVILISMASCAPKITGTWKIISYEESTSGDRGATFSNIGAITFDKDGKGSKEISYSIMGISMEDNLPFTWIMEDSTITIEGEDSEFAKTWIVIESKRRSQVWKSTDGSDEVHRLKLSK